MRNMNAIVSTVDSPTVFSDSLAWSAAPTFTSQAMSSRTNVASNPGIGSGSSTSQTLRKMMKYMIPRKPANIDAMMPMNASCIVSTFVRSRPPETM